MTAYYKDVLDKASKEAFQVEVRKVARRTLIAIGTLTVGLAIVNHINRNIEAEEEIQS